MDFVLAEIAEIARVPKRSVRLWADAEVIEAAPGTMLAGSGTHRRFSRTELIIACILGPFAKQKVAIGALKALARNIRISITSKHTRSFVLPVIEGAIQGEANYLEIYWSDPERANGKEGENLLLAGVHFKSESQAKRSLSEVLKSPSAVIKFEVVFLDRILKGIPRS